MLSKKIVTIATIASVWTLGTSATLLVSALTAESATASMVDATILADNGSIAVHQQGNTFKVIPDSVAGNWPRPKTFRVDIPDDERSLSQCKLHVISWGDGAVAQGVMAHFAGNAGIAYTGKSGSPLNNVSMSPVMQPPGGIVAGQNFANNDVNAKAIITSPGSGSTVFVSKPVISGGIPGTWGPINLPANMQERGNVKFIWNEKSNSLNANPNNYRVLSMPCSTVVKPEPEKPQAQSLASWEIAGQFNAAQNPFEVWTYGYTVDPNCNGPVIPYKIKGSNSAFGRNFDHWLRNTLGDSNDHPTVSQSKGNTLLSPMKLSPNGLVLQPGTQNQCTVVRFTAPAAGNYSLMGRFWAQFVNSPGSETDTDVMVTVNSMVSGSSVTTLVPSTNIKGSGPVTNKPFMATGVSLAAGGTIDFKVGSNGNFNYDLTGLHGYIQRDEK
jgi:hypothetical protein